MLTWQLTSWKKGGGGDVNRHKREAGPTKGSLSVSATPPATGNSAIRPGPSTPVRLRPSLSCYRQLACIPPTPPQPWTKDTWQGVIGWEEGRRMGRGKRRGEKGKELGGVGKEKKNRSNQSSWITVSGEVQLVPPFSGPSRLFTSLQFHILFSSNFTRTPQDFFIYLCSLLFRFFTCAPPKELFFCVNFFCRLFNFCASY
jgi:hypothetical protein